MHKEKVISRRWGEGQSHRSVPLRPGSWLGPVFMVLPGLHDRDSVSSHPTIRRHYSYSVRVVTMEVLDDERDDLHQCGHEDIHDNRNMIQSTCGNWRSCKIVARYSALNALQENQGNFGMIRIIPWMLGDFLTHCSLLTPAFADPCVTSSCWFCSRFCMGPKDCNH